jgi:hypothetical protein
MARIRIGTSVTGTPTPNRRPVYPPSSIKHPRKPKRPRATQAEMQERRDALYAIVAEGHPMTVRQTYYQATVRGIVDKTEDGYNKVQDLLAQMRRQELLPWDWIIDNTRRVIRPATYAGIAECLEDAADSYRKSLWLDKDCRVQIWLEKDALSGVVSPVTDTFDVPLCVARGYSSITFLNDMAEEIADAELPTYVYHLGDYDPSGLDAARKVDKELRELSSHADIHFERLAVTQAQIRDWRLPSRPTKKSDPRAASFKGDSVELDAIAPNVLRRLLSSAIGRHMPPEELKRLQRIEAEERARIAEMVEDLL